MPEFKRSELPNPFVCESGDIASTLEAWQSRRREINKTIVNLEYGGMPPMAEAALEILHSATSRQFLNARVLSCRVHVRLQTDFQFSLRLIVPDGQGPFPVFLCGDACWTYMTDDVVSSVVSRGYILAQFNRVDIAPDVGSIDRTSGLYPHFPSLSFGALSAWAWGFHRCVDAIWLQAFVDTGKIAVVGHSRGGKAALLAGATDERIALTSANNSGAGGAGCFRHQGPSSETLQDLMARFPYWFGPQLQEYVGREGDLPFDQHWLNTLVAPRALLTTEALGDLWANPEGTWQSHLAAQEVYRFLGADENIAISFREGGHDHSLADWTTLLDFSDAVFFQLKRPDFQRSIPLKEIPPVFDWRSPKAQ